MNSSEFLDPADLRQIGWDWDTDRPVFLQLADLRYRSARLGGRVILVPAEFVTDVASVPRRPLTWLVAGGRGLRPSLPHDFAYEFGFWWITEPDGIRSRLDVAKPLVDEVFRESLLADPMSGAGRTMAWMMYQAVRFGGRGHWVNPARTEKLNPIWTREWGLTMQAP